MAEQWKAIPGYEDCYEVSNRGRVRSLERTTRHGRVRKRHTLKASPGAGGYLKVDLSKDNKQRTRTVHQLVLEAFAGPGDGRRRQACHYNGDCQDNRLTNLRWGTARDNAVDRSRHGRHRGSTILTEDEVRVIKMWPRYGRGLYDRFPFVSKSTIDAIRSGYNWKGVQGSPS